MDKAHYEAAIDRNLVELERALFNLQAMTAMEKAGGMSDVNLKVIYFALFNDYIAHCIKVLDRHRDSASFWYLHKENPSDIERLAGELGVDLSDLERMSDKLKHVRDKTHFHIDRKAVYDPKQVWRDADINGKDLSDTVHKAWALLNACRLVQGKDRMDSPTLDGSVITQVTEMIEKGEVRK